jgi:iron complex outermembrane receptor protein
LYFDGRDTTDFYQRAWFLQGRGTQPEQLGAPAHDTNTSWAAFGQVSYDDDRRTSRSPAGLAARPSDEKTYPACSRPPTPPQTPWSLYRVAAPM